MTGGPLARAYHLLNKIDLGPDRNSGRGPLLEFNVGCHPGDSTHYVNAKDKIIQTKRCRSTAAYSLKQRQRVECVSRSPRASSGDQPAAAWRIPWRRLVQPPRLAAV